MNKLILNKITVVCVDDNADRGITALLKSLEQIDFNKAILFTSKDSQFYNPNIDIIKIPVIGNKENYSMFILKELYKYINTEFCLIVQWDGNIINPSAWTDDFYNYDYIGARWFWRPQPWRVGNGGFSLRSKKLMEFMVTDPGINICHPEDNCVCLVNRAYLEEHGFKYAPEKIAIKFAVENEKYTGQFGWHGGNHPKI
jgi:hypothetical protein